jgi:hypothetical protein
MPSIINNFADIRRRMNHEPEAVSTEKAETNALPCTQSPTVSTTPSHPCYADKSLTCYCNPNTLCRRKPKAPQHPKG